jgi:hypothetical protein
MITMSKLYEDIQKWKKLTDLQETSGDRITCPECDNQVAFCDCPQRLAHEILTAMDEENMFDLEDSKDYPLKLTVRIKAELSDHPEWSSSSEFLNFHTEKTSTLDQESGITTNHYRYRSLIDPKE